jgi:chromatin segregation and condensation protein Rec8/ScpA/Scc1 (kleisin family)
MRLIADCKTRLEAIVTFLAVLDLLKTEELRAEQSVNFGYIHLRIPDHRTEAAETA